MQLDKNAFYFMGFVTLFGFSTLGAAILFYASDIALIEFFQVGESWLVQLPLGLLFGLFTGAVAWWLIDLPFMQKVKTQYKTLLNDFEINWFDIIFISVCAGYGEEILFRACMQYYLGIVPTAIIFVAIHGYLNPMNWRLCIYGLYMTLVIVAIGYGFDRLGILSAIAAHFMIDVVLLYKMKREQGQESAT